MSLAVFPQLKGLQFGTNVTPIFNTGISSSVNGHETRNSYQPYPLWEFELSYEWLPNRQLGNQDLDRIVGFFLDRQGSFEAFLYLAPETPYENMTKLGVGDGTNKVFTLLKTTGGFFEPAGGVDTELDIQLFVDGAVISYGDFTLADNRDVTFTTAPANGAIVQACYQPLYRVRFKEDSAQFSQFMSHLWELQQLTLRSVFA